MKISLELSPDVEAQLRASVARRDIDAARRLLAQAVAPTIDALLLTIPEEVATAEFEAVADQVAEELSRALGPNVPLLSDYAISREGIYEDHP